MQQDPGDIDRKIDEAVRTIAKLFRDIEFTDEEQRFVESAGRQLLELGHDVLVQWPNVAELRPFVVLFAMAATLGSYDIFRDGIPALRELPPTADAAK
jgi:hypothetical protein